MKKGNLSSVTLAVSLVFGSNTIAANPCIEKSTEFRKAKIILLTMPIRFVRNEQINWCG